MAKLTPLQNRSLTVRLACNDSEGRCCGAVDAVDLSCPDRRAALGEQRLALSGPSVPFEWLRDTRSAGTMLLIYGFTLGGRSYGARHHSPWVGSRVWDSCEMFFGDARLLLRYLIFLGYTADEQPLEGLLFFLLKDATR